jgi:hypothetical protein
MELPLAIDVLALLLEERRLRPLLQRMLRHWWAPQPQATQRLGLRCPFAVAPVPIEICQASRHHIGHNIGGAIVWCQLSEKIKGRET